MSVEEQVKLAIKGDEKAFEFLMNLYKEGLYRTAFAYVKNEQDATDILQETVYKAYISIEKIKEPRYFKTWITKILINTSIDYVRKNKKVVYITEDLPENPGSYEANAIDEKLDILNSIEKLDDRYKNVVVLKYFQDLTITEISQVLNCPSGTVKTYLNKALSKLRLFLNEEIV